MIQNRDVDWSELIRFTASGIVIADYNQIRNAVTARFKEIYGSDIDLSTGTVDGIYIEMLSLIISNICQGFYHFYASLDVNMANGKMLDRLCALSNVARKAAMPSTAVVNVTLDASETADYHTKKLELLDRNGTIWLYQSANDELVFIPGEPQAVIVHCKELGPVRADPGWINRLVNTDVVMTIEQTESAVLGINEELDSELRARRNQSLGLRGNSVLESLAGALLSINGIQDVKIYNNDTAGTITAKDSTEILPHSVYVILRQIKNIWLTDKLLGSIIYEKMTPGILTTKAAAGIPHTYKYVQYVLGTPIDSDIVQNVSWKEATFQHPDVAITITPFASFASANNAALQKIAEDAKKYLNELPLSQDIIVEQLRRVVADSDMRFKGQATYGIKSITIASKAADFVNNDVYFQYTNGAITKNEDGTWLLTLN